MNKHFSPLYILAVFSALFVIPQSQAQHELISNDIMYHAIYLPQSNDYNPAFYMQDRTFYLTLPQFNISTGLPVSFNDLNFQTDPVTQHSILNLSDLAKKIGSGDNQIRSNFNLNLLGFGINFGNVFVNFSSKVAVQARLSIPTDAIAVLTNMNKHSWIGEQNAANLVTGDLALVNAYARFSIGGGYKFDKIPLTIGAHVNILDGVANINTYETNIRAYAVDDIYSAVVADVDYHVQRSGCVGIDTNNNLYYDGTPKNFGFTFDLGAKYDFNNFHFSASLIDFGPGIHWSQDVVKMSPHESHIFFVGFDVSNLISGGRMDGDFFNNYLDSIATMLKTQETKGGDFWYAVPTKLNLGASYDFANKFFRAGFLFHGEWEKGLFTAPANNNFRFNTTLSLSCNLFNWLELMVANSFVFDGANTDMLNPGAGVVLSLGQVFQIYAMLDYLSDFYLVKAKSFNFSLGLNIVAGKRETKSVPSIPDNEGSDSVL